MSQEESTHHTEPESKSPTTSHQRPLPSPPPPPPHHKPKSSELPKKSVFRDEAQPSLKKHHALPIHKSNSNHPQPLMSKTQPSTSPSPPDSESSKERKERKEHFPLIKSIARGEKPIIHKIQAEVAKRRIHKTVEARERMVIDDDDGDGDWSLRDVYLDLGGLRCEDEGMMPISEETVAVYKDGEAEGEGKRGKDEGGRRPKIDFSHSSCAVEKYLELADMGNVSFATPKEGEVGLRAVGTSVENDMGKGWITSGTFGTSPKGKSIGTSAIAGNSPTYKLFPDAGQDSGTRTKLAKKRVRAASAGKLEMKIKRDTVLSEESRAGHKSATTASKLAKSSLATPLPDQAITTGAFPHNISTALPQFKPNIGEVTQPDTSGNEFASSSLPFIPQSNLLATPFQGHLSPSKSGPEPVPPPSSISTQTQSSGRQTHTTVSSSSSCSSTSSFAENIPDSPLMSNKKNLSGILKSEIYNRRYVGREQYYITNTFHSSIRPPISRDSSWVRNKPDWSTKGREDVITPLEKEDGTCKEFCFTDLSSEQTTHIFDFLQAADAFITWDKSTNKPSLLDLSPESKLLFTLRFAKLTSHFPFPLLTRDSEAAHVISSSASCEPVFNYDNDNEPAAEFIGLYSAAKMLIEQFVESKGEVFSGGKARELSSLVLGCLDEACEPEMTSQMPREGLEAVIPRILECLARESSFDNSELGDDGESMEEIYRDEDEESSNSEVVVPVRLWYWGFKERVREARHIFVEVWPVEIFFIAVLLIGIGIWHVLEILGIGRKFSW